MSLFPSPKKGVKRLINHQEEPIYRYIVVDDEMFIRQGLVKKISRLAMPLTCVGQAGNGVEGLKLVKEEDPDIIISDMKMPEMDGVDFLQKVSTQYKEKQIIVLSSYQDFSYMRTAIENGAVGYVLKPYSAEEMHKQLKKAIERAQSSKHRMEQVQELGMLKRRVHGRKLFNLLIHPWDSEQEQEFGSLYGSIREMRVISIRTNSPHLMGELEEVCSVYGDEVRAIPMENPAGKYEYFVLLLYTGKKANGLASPSDRIVDLLERKEPESVQYIAVSEPAVGLSAAHDLYLKNRERFSQVRLSQTRCVLRQDNPPQSQLHTSEEIHNLFLSMRYNPESVPEIMEVFISRLTQADAPFGIIIKECGKLMELVNAYTEQSGEDSNATVEIAFHRYQFDPDLERMKRELTGYISLAFKSVQNSSSSQEQLMNQIKAYIDKNYSQKITLETIAAAFYINPSYLSHVFKLKARENFNEYLTRVRMDKARKLLRDTPLTMERISGEIGYRNPKYFFKLFKGYMGMTPNEFRTQIDRKAGK